ncbi:DUF6160 family protein [Marinobacter xestospongiae]|uniref:DUF6160 family protein n=1 Tax=Marinobacter xestospongiae TaxID=994319 RepID=UPI002004F804|nr:DUF6160 family protein [Marinobacter xestospongiae]MCK7565309.1 DUF6160 family protein [Marinobacter xestospongiae]
MPLNRDSFSASAAAGLLVSAGLWLTAMPTQALERLDDGEMGVVTGQAGITMELAARIDIGQVRYVDEAPLDFNQVRLSGHNGTMLDNLKLTLDVAGPGEVLDYGFSELARRGDQGILDPNHWQVADAMNRYSVAGEFGRQYNDGDLVIHLSPVDSGDPASLNDYLNAVDFELAIDSIVTGGQPTSTTMFENILLQGYLGPTDIVVGNTDNSRVLPSGTLVQGAETHISSHFAITNGQLDWNVGNFAILFNFAAVGIEGLRLHNNRGDDMLGHFGMAYAEASISKGTSGTSGQDGLSIHNVDFRADLDIDRFKVGGHSIGSVYMTDINIQDASFLVYGH